MKNHPRKLTLCSILFASAACYAQSGVSIYGTVDLSLGTASTHPTAGPSRRITQLNPAVGTSSILGFRGTEDLGGGLSALFQLETSVNADTGVAGSPAAASGTLPAAPSFFNRHSWVGLRSTTIGTLRLGRSLTPTIQAYIPVNALPSGTNTGITGALTAQGLNNDFYQSNLLGYYSPSYGGFSVQAMATLGEVAPGGKGGNSYGLVARYDHAGNTVAVAAHRDKDAQGNHVDWQMVVGAFNIGRFKLTAGMNRVDVPATLQSGATAPYRDSRMATVGALYRATELISLGLQHFQVKDTASGKGSHLTNFNARYALSKRTAVYFMSGMATNRTLAIIPANGFAASANARQRAYSVGVNHNF
jgi:GBP family porin